MRFFYIKKIESGVYHVGDVVLPLFNRVDGHEGSVVFGQWVWSEERASRWHEWLKQYQHTDKYYISDSELKQIKVVFSKRKLTLRKIAIFMCIDLFWYFAFAMAKTIAFIFADPNVVRTFKNKNSRII